MAIVDYILGVIHRDEEGQGLAEYALILALIAIVAIVALIFLGGQVNDDPVERRHRHLAHSPSPGAIRSRVRWTRLRRFRAGAALHRETDVGLDSVARRAYGSDRCQGAGSSRFAGDYPRKGGNPSMSILSAIINLFHTDEEGQGLAEYALILALIAVLAIVALMFLGGQINAILSTVGTAI